MGTLKQIASYTLALWLIATASVTHAEDVDLFLGLPADSTGNPNVLFVIDNAANWSRTAPAGGPYSDQITAALAQIFRELPPDRVNVGMMFFPETDERGEDGGVIRAAIRQMTSANKELYAAAIESLDETNKSNNSKVGLTFAEAYYYFAGLRPFAGTEKIRTDFAGNTAEVCTTENVAGAEVTTCAPTPWAKVWGLGSNAMDSQDASQYNKPGGAACVKNYIIFISNGASNENTPDINKSIAMLTAAGGTHNQLALNPSSQQDNPTDEWAKWMREESPEQITVFTVDIDKVTTGQGPGWTAVLQSTAEESDGKYYDVTGDASEIADAVRDALSSILSVNSVFSSVALPASTNAQSTFLNQVYVGLFRPDEVADPRWFGNLKQFKLDFETSGGSTFLRLFDAADEAVIDPGTGFVRECSRSFWTPETMDNYWAYLEEPRGECVAVPNSGVSNTPDGPVVEKGGQAYQQRSVDPASRVIKTCGLASCASLTDFAVTNSALVGDVQGVTGLSSVNAQTLIAWARGHDTEDEDGDSNVLEARPSLHLDVIHSQPVALDYSSDPTNPEVVVFYSGNDGILRGINGNRTSTHRSTEAGREMFAFVPPEFYGSFDRLRQNDTKVKFPATGVYAGVEGEQKEYGIDGALTAFDGDIAGSRKRYLYAGMRRGGRSYYAFDVTDPSAPTLLWKKGCPNLNDDTGCDTGWEGIGQTWSAANVFFAEGVDKPLLLIGGGYDDCEDFDDNLSQNHACNTSNKGDVIYVVDGTNGDILKTFTQTSDGRDIERGIAGNITWVPKTDDDLVISWAYAADMGGNVYRLSAGTTDAPAPIGTTDPSQWILLKMADLGCSPTATSSCTNPRKFLYGPDVVREPGDGRFTLVIGSGDREKPLYDYGAAGGIQNYIYSMIDEPADPTWLADPSPEVCFDDVICNASLADAAIDGTVTPTAQGWKLALGTREQVVSGALVVADIVNVSTHIPVLPNNDSCEADLGTAYTYNIDFEDAEGDRKFIISGGLPPTPVAGKVILDDGQIVPFCIGCGGEGSAIGATEVTGSLDWTQPKTRVSWEIEQ